MNETLPIDLEDDPTEDADGPMGPTRMVSEVEEWAEWSMGPQSHMHALQVLSKPVIAAISGHAVAGGLELAVWADLRVVEEDAVMGVFCRCGSVPVSVCTFGHLTCHAIPCTITRRWGVPLIDGGTVRLPRLIGMGAAMDLIRTPPYPCC